MIASRHNKLLQVVTWGHIIALNLELGREDMPTSHLRDIWKIYG